MNDELLSRLLMGEGKLQREGEVIHVIVKRCFNISKLFQQLTATKEELSLKPMSRADETTSPFPKKTTGSEVVQGNIFGEGRNFRVNFYLILKYALAALLNKATMTITMITMCIATSAVV